MHIFTVLQYDIILVLGLLCLVCRSTCKDMRNLEEIQIHLYQVSLAWGRPNPGPMPRPQTQPRPRPQSGPSPAPARPWLPGWRRSRGWGRGHIYGRSRGQAGQGLTGARASLAVCRQATATEERLGTTASGNKNVDFDAHATPQDSFAYLFIS